MRLIRKRRIIMVWIKSYMPYDEVARSLHCANFWPTRGGAHPSASYVGYDRCHGSKSSLMPCTKNSASSTFLSTPEETFSNHAHLTWWLVLCLCKGCRRWWEAGSVFSSCYAARCGSGHRWGDVGQQARGVSDAVFGGWGFAIKCHILMDSPPP